MRRLNCPNCGARVFFENFFCGSCGVQFAFAPSGRTMVAIDTPNAQAPAPGAASNSNNAGRACGNRAEDVCNWAVEDDRPFCRSCSLNEVVPNLTNPKNRELWRNIEIAKRRVILDLMRLGLPVISRAQDPEHGLAFKFLSSEDGGEQVLTGHQEGLITLDIAEADDAEREKRRTKMGEPYRTLIGHFRHELAHYYWDLLIKNGPDLEACRAIFGDERLDYGEALKKHYDNGPPADWQQNFVSSYATMHPWEDWAETTAHFTHIAATLDTAEALSLTPGEAPTVSDPYRAEDFDALIKAFVALSGAINEVNRSMGVPDIYPFVLAPPVIEKLRFIYEVARKTRQGQIQPDPSDKPQQAA